MPILIDHIDESFLKTADDKSAVLEELVEPFCFGCVNRAYLKKYSVCGNSFKDSNVCVFFRFFPLF